MKNIVWTGNSDARALSPKDLELAGVEIKDSMMFPRLQAVEVTNNVAKALLDNPDIYGSFTLAKGEVDEGEMLDFSQLEEPPTPDSSESPAVDGDSTSIDDQ